MKIRINNIDLGTSKIAAIKLTRYLTGWGLKESKDFVEAANGGDTSLKGIIHLDIEVNMSLPNFVDKSFDELVALIVADRWLAPLNDAKNIENLDAPVKKTRPTIASLTKELEEERKLKNSYNAYIAALKLEIKTFNQRIEENDRALTASYQNESILTNKLVEKQERIDRLEDALYCQSEQISVLKNKATEIVVNGTKIIVTNDSITYLKQ